MSMNPELRATYRIQLHKEFTLLDAAEMASYYSNLGVSHLYLSPILESRPGSTHGYDGLNPEQISGERGGSSGLQALIEALRATTNLKGVILDIVPNHLAANWKNPSWWDALKNGTSSKYWNHYDIRPVKTGRNRIMLPILDRSLQSNLNSRKVGLIFQEGVFLFTYGDLRLPVSPESYSEILQICLRKDESLQKYLKDIAKNKDAAALLEQSYKKGKIKGIVFKKALEELSVKNMTDILERQNFILRDWRSGSQEINYRRFFDINDLAAIRVEDQQVFDWSHSKIKHCLQKYPEVHGLRVDHVDGLTEPADYLKKLARLSPRVWIEKILGEGETLPSHWETVGTTGYEFSNVGARLFVRLPGLLRLHSHYVQSVDSRWEQFHDCVYDSKKEILAGYFIAEWQHITDNLYDYACKDKKPSFNSEELHEVIGEVTAALRVYRTYAEKGKPLQSEFLKKAFLEAEGRAHYSSQKAFDWFRRFLTQDNHKNEKIYLTLKKWEQLSGPVMAKGLEDTALYRYCPLLSLNGVGGEPDWLGDGLAEFHTFNRERLKNTPLAMNTTSTHDTKRSEDVRQRIHVLSEFPNNWLKAFDTWRRLDHRNPLDRRTKYLIFETLIGAWPFDGKITREFVERMQNYFLKAAREAKTETSWAEPNEEYEKNLKGFVENILMPREEAQKKILRNLDAFARVCTYYGAFNSLSLVALKALSPGLPDFYQGCEMWDLSLVDPDNRRPVNYRLHRKILSEIKKQKSDPSFLRNLVRNWRDGEIKLWLTSELLDMRKSNPDLYIKGDYSVVSAKGPLKNHFISFIRRHEDQWVWVIVPRYVASIQRPSGMLCLKNPELAKTLFQLPKDAPKKWRHRWSQKILSGADLNAEDCFGGLPIAILQSP